ncbi:unnamed protein product [Phaedon cochleariae]|uniref:Uncharacterized protein n=1 Tax=Phaedon cochleariae TaxID=80249 RepID=A0A9N9X3R6_PHACE|nr:unnamed protein product [Phaedon cochleariae]
MLNVGVGEAVAAEEAGRPARPRRQHGLQLPLHPLQLSGWLTLAILSGGAFLVLIPALPFFAQPAALAVLSVLLLLHLATHLASTLIDPAEKDLRERKPEPIEVRPRDRVRALPPVPDSDELRAHQTLQLVQQVRAPLRPPLQVAEPVRRRAQLRRLPDESLGLDLNSTVPSPTSSLPSSDAAFLAVVAALGLLAAITAGLLLHLCFFHIYISFLGLTTYEYIRNQRQNQLPTTLSKNGGAEERVAKSPTSRHRPINLRCGEERTRTTLFTCTVLEETFSNCNAEPTPTPPTTPQDCQMCVITSNSVAPETAQQKRVKERWNCCVSVPDSPDDPHSPTEPKWLLSLCRHKTKTKSIPVIDGRPHRTHGHWSSAKLRMLFRVIGNLGQTKRRPSQQSTTLPRSNQVVPNDQPSSEPIRSGQLPTRPSCPAQAPPHQRNRTGQCPFRPAAATTALRAQKAAVQKKKKERRPQTEDACAQPDQRKRIVQSGLSVPTKLYGVCECQHHELMP